jgi:hypothetical protein
MRQLQWSQNKAGTFNGKVGHITLFSVAYYAERGYFVTPKLPGLNKVIPVNSFEAGKRKAEAIYKQYFNFLKGAAWDRERDNPEPTSPRVDSGKKALRHSKPILPAMVNRCKSNG